MTAWPQPTDMWLSAVQRKRAFIKIWQMAGLGHKRTLASGRCQVSKFVVASLTKRRVRRSRKKGAIRRGREWLTLRALRHTGIGG